MTVVPRLPLLAADPPRHEALWNAALSHAGQPIPLATAGAAATFALTKVPDGNAPCLVVEAGAGPTLYVCVSSFPYRAMFGADLEAADLLHLPPVLRDALAEGMISLIWSAAPAQALGAHAIVAIGRMDQIAGDAESSGLAWFSFTLNGLASEPIALSLGCTRGDLVEWLGRSTVPSRRVYDNLKSQLRATAVFTLGSAQFPVHDVRALGEGALVLLPPIEPQTCDVRVGETMHRFRSADGGWTFVGSSDVSRRQERANAGRGDGIMNGEAASSAEGAPKLSDLQVTVDFDLGARSIALAEIEGWQAGAVVALDPPQRADGVEVTLRVNGNAIGAGELVRIDERYAIRLSRLFLAP
jgi:flagellar motor switch/type III secretory pathway protein FliN